MTFTADPRCFSDENTLIFLRQCYEYYKNCKHAIKQIFVIPPKTMITSTGDVIYDTHSNLKKLCIKLFKNAELAFLSENKCLTEYLRRTYGSSHLLLLRNNGDRIRVLYVSDNGELTESDIRDIRSFNNITSESVTASALASSLGNTVSILGDVKIILDRTYPFSEPFFAEDFRNTVSLYEAHPNRVSVTLSELPINIAYAAYFTLGEYTKRTIEEQNNRLSKVQR